MRSVDIGALPGDVVAFGGVYSNLQALEALLEVAAGRASVCTGDVVAYCADAAGSVDLMRASGLPVVAGNCEINLAQGALDCGCGFAEGSACDVLSVGWYAHAEAALSADDKAWMGGLPDILLARIHGESVAFLHGGITDVSAFLWEISPVDVFQNEIKLLKRHIEASHPDILPIRYIVSGHSGIPFIRHIGEVTWVNAGAIGMPPNDGGRETRYAVFTKDGPRIERLSYDWQSAQKAMKSAGLMGYHDALDSGYWPSEEVLPLEMRVSDKG